LGHRPQVGPAQVVGRHPLEQVGHQADVPLVDPDGAAQTAPRFGAEHRQGQRRLLERLALDQPVQQQVTLLPEGQLLVEVEVVAGRKQPAALELDQRGGDE
jgi:hypothetical protein